MSASITTRSVRPGVVEITIVAKHYGMAGAHWKRTLSGPRHGGFGRIFIQRWGVNRRRYDSCYDLRGVYRGNPGVNIDECPGAMFIWDGPRFHASIEPIDPIDNQKLGRELGHALRQFEQKTEADLWEVQFRFL